jgi:hypothetical protein
MIRGAARGICDAALSPFKKKKGGERSWRWPREKKRFSWQVTDAGDAALARVRVLIMFISAPSHRMLNLVHVRAAGRVVHHASSRNRTIFTSLITGWRTMKTCPNFAYMSLYSVFAMTSRTTTCCKNAQGGHVNPRSRVPLYSIRFIDIRHGDPAPLAAALRGPADLKSKVLF